MAIRIEGEGDRKKKERVSKIADPKPPEIKNESLVEDSVTRDSNSNSQGKEETKSSLEQHGAQISNESTGLKVEAKQDIQIASKEKKVKEEEVPRLTMAGNNLQEQNIQVGAEAAESYFKLQEQLIDSTRTIWILYAEQATKLFWNSLLAPQRMLELYTNYIANFSDTWILANRNINHFFTENMEKVNINLEQAKRISNDLAGACMNLSKMEAKKMDVMDTKSQAAEAQAEQEVTMTKTKIE